MSPARVSVARDEAELLELGRRFDEALREARRLDVPRQRLFSALQQIVEAENIRTLPRAKYAVACRRASNDSGYSAAVGAFQKVHSEAVRLMKAIHRAKASTLAGVAVKLTAVAFDMADFEVSLRPKGEADVAERQVFQLERQVRELVKGGGE